MWKNSNCLSSALVPQQSTQKTPVTTSVGCLPTNKQAINQFWRGHQLGILWPSLTPTYLPGDNIRSHRLRAQSPRLPSPLTSDANCKLQVILPVFLTYWLQIGVLTTLSLASISLLEQLRETCLLVYDKGHYKGYR